MIQFDEHIFQMGWFNHQLANFDLNFCCVQIGETWNLETRRIVFWVPVLSVPYLPNFAGCANQVNGNKTTKTKLNCKSVAGLNRCWHEGVSFRMSCKEIGMESWIYLAVKFCQSCFCWNGRNPFWVVVSNVFLCSPQFDEHIFQMGWFNHQLALLFVCVFFFF